MNSDKSQYFPILVNLGKFKSLVIGGGPIAFRKAMNLLNFGGQVTVLTPEMCPSMQALADEKKIELMQKSYEKGDVNGYSFVFAATDNEEVDNMIKDDCDKLGILLNVADVPDLCNFIMPATIKRGRFIAAISTQGDAPFFAKEMKQHISKILSPMVADVTDLAGEFRIRLMNDPRYGNPELRYELFHKFLEINWEKVLYEYGKTGADKKMDELFAE